MTVLTSTSVYVDEEVEAVEYGAGFQSEVELKIWLHRNSSLPKVSENCVLGTVRPGKSTAQLKAVSARVRAILGSDSPLSDFQQPLVEFSCMTSKELSADLFLTASSRSQEDWRVAHAYPTLRA